MKRPLRTGGSARIAAAAALASVFATAGAPAQERSGAGLDSVAVQDSVRAGAEAGRLAARRWDVGWYAIGGLAGGLGAGFYGAAVAVPNYPDGTRRDMVVVSFTHVGLLALLGRHSNDVVLADSIRHQLDGHHPAFRGSFEDAYRRELAPRRRRVLLRSTLVGAGIGSVLWVLLAASAPWT